jgi:hypothetical protein
LNISVIFQCIFDLKNAQTNIVHENWGWENKQVSEKELSGPPSNRSLGKLNSIPTCYPSVFRAQTDVPPTPAGHARSSTYVPGVTTVREPILCPISGARHTAK